MMKLPKWIISDTHWFHVNIIDYAGRPANHNDRMIGAWRSLVEEDDDVLHLGDVLMGPQTSWPTLPIPTGHVKVLVADHDEPRKQRWISKHWGWEWIGPIKLTYRDHMVFFTHHPLDSVELGQTGINIHGHIHERPAPSPQHINVCVEQIHYQPVLLRELLDKRIDILDTYEEFDPSDHPEN